MAEPDEEGAGLSSFAPAPAGTWTDWTPAARENAEPLPIVTLPGSPPGGGRTAALGNGPTDQASTFGSVEGDPSKFAAAPNDANGKLFGKFKIPLDSGGVEIEEYACSASVVPSRRGNVILTAAHCVIDPETGTVATEHSVEFIPGYREGEGGEGVVAPYGTWEATEYATTESWEKAAKGGPRPNEGGDLALVTLAANKEQEGAYRGENVENVVGSLGIAFDRSCSQTYTQFGYPAEPPYSGRALFANVAAYAGTDSNPAILPKPIRIASDFTRGSSGGPWTIGSGGESTALSLTAYGYENQPGYLYGPYFGEMARKAYVRAAGKFVPIGIEETCQPVPEPPVSPEAPAPAPSPPAAAPPVASPVGSDVSLRLTRVRRRNNGSAVLITKVSSAGKLKLRGADVRTETVNTSGAGKYRLIVAPKGSTSRKLQRKGRVKVGVKVAFSAAGKTRRIKRSIRLARHRVERSNRHHHVRRPR